ncbi:amino acid permease [Streptomyces sp. NPDC005202]|uniref:amino acid permease n=1 Tax=Streptomyces sp. NPDC005202 TaxID=3157021 RepID=UPI0033AB83C2
MSPPGVPQWVFSLVLMTLLTASNLVSTRSFGETEFWLSSIKVVTIVVFLVTGTLFALGLWPGATLSVGNVALDGFAPHGISSVLHGIVLVIFAYVGTEIVTIAAAESADPVKSMVKATSATVWRVITFYVGSVTLLVMITPWDQVPTQTSPYAAAFGKLGIPAAATIINVAVLTTVLSVLNSGLYTASRMLFALQRNRWAPRWVADRGRKGTPWKAILTCTSAGYVAVAMSYVAPDTIFDFIINSAGAVGLFVYAIIAGSQLRMRRKLKAEAPERLKLRMWRYPYLSWVTLAAIVGVVSSMLLVQDARSQLYLSVLSLAAILATYLIVRYRQKAATGRYQARPTARPAKGAGGQSSVSAVTALSRCARIRSRATAASPASRASRS